MITCVTLQDQGGQQTEETLVPLSLEQLEKLQKQHLRRATEIGQLDDAQVLLKLRGRPEGVQRATDVLDLLLLDLALVTLDPPRTLDFVASEGGAPGTAALNITNVSAGYLAYKLKATAPKTYTVQPRSGIIAAGGHAKVQITLNPDAASGPNDRLLVQVTPPSSSQTPAYDDWPTIPREVIQDHHLHRTPAHTSPLTRQQSGADMEMMKSALKDNLGCEDCCLHFISESLFVELYKRRRELSAALLVAKYVLNTYETHRVSAFWSMPHAGMRLPRYTVRPRSGIIAPRGHAKVEIILNPDAASGLPINDRFLVQVTPASSSQTPAYEEWPTIPREVIQDHHLNVAFEETPSPSGGYHHRQPPRGWALRDEGGQATEERLIPLSFQQLQKQHLGRTEIGQLDDAQVLLKLRGRPEGIQTAKAVLDLMLDRAFDTISPPKTIEFPTSRVAVLKLTNVSVGYLAYKIKTTAPRSYLVRPSSGVISPRGDAIVEIIMQPKATAEGGLPTNDRFLVQVTPTTSSQTPARDLCSTTAKEHIQDHRLNVVVKDTAGTSREATPSAMQPPQPTEQPPQPTETTSTFWSWLGRFCCCGPRKPEPRAPAHNSPIGEDAADAATETHLLSSRQRHADHEMIQRALKNNLGLGQCYRCLHFIFDMSVSSHI
ncbi:unnamed protein product [Vitrella brassicaformis CCMP3155]|uniref:MSP domain-containing protein n=1 Tax=Vitrella brassicaformis (strain CCMP3155) TaxID=1169540 RepID=A0A0G4F5E0_VITBC|nr:unnamed protein product [Vitrella brassicaformis CCMP3155]|eukprot:CEM06948.1 unnamed protein product [Vitrella brassicaformis CCMP3155]